MLTVIYSIIILGCIGLFFGFFLGFINKKLKIPNNEIELEIINSLPGANCGACGYPGCSACGSAIFNKKAKINACPVGGADSANKISHILNIKIEDIEQKIAYCNCNGYEKNIKLIYTYIGINSCILAKSYFNGQKSCKYSCLGFGSCSQICPFNAIIMKNSMPYINKNKCVGCGKCILICPQNILSLIPKRQNIFINCNNTLKGKDVLSNCSVGCIKCKKCENTCRYDAIHVTNIAKIDYTKCTNCKECIDICPTKCITTFKYNF